MNNVVTQDDNQHNDIVQFLSFSLGDDDYGVDILRVQEIRGWEEVRSIPHTPDYIKGVLDLRNIVVPIVDLRVRFLQENVDYNATTVIIVLSVECGEHKSTIGIVVDTVSDVLDVKRKSIKQAPNFGSKIDTRYINGMVSVDERMVILLDTDKLLNPEEMSEIEKISV